MPKKRNIIAAAIAMMAAAMAVPAGAAYAHGANVTYTTDVEVGITARYDSGEPMGGAQVAVYSPQDPSTPWLTGTCDEEGRFTFTPDTSMPGTWVVQVRQAGHGDIIHIPIGQGASTADNNSGYTKTQIGIMAAGIAWGCVGTALYFSRRRGR